MKNQALLSAKDKSKKLKCRLLQFSFGALRIKSLFFLSIHFQNRFLQPTALIYLRDIVGLTQILLNVKLINKCLSIIMYDISCVNLTASVILALLGALK